VVNRPFAPTPSAEPDVFAQPAPARAVARAHAPVHRSVVVAIGLAISFALAGCGAAATPAPSTPPEATGSLLPPATATVGPSTASAAPASAEPTASFPLTLTDDEGTVVRLAAKPQKIVSLTPAETEVLYAIGAGDRVVGKVEDVAKYPPAADHVPIVATFSGVDAEKIVSLGADLVIAGGNGGTPADAIAKLRSLKIPVLVVYAPDVETVDHDIELSGQAVGEPARADALVATLKSQFQAVADATASAAKPRVFYETGDQPSIYGIADASVYAQMIALAGGTPITTGSTTSWEMPTEKLVAANPDLIILGDAAYGVTPDAVAKRPGWAGLTAVKNQAIVGIDDIVVTRPGPRLGEGLQLLAAAIHPELHLPVPSAAASGG
jgi:iron complex transport system substrate-binding protein